MHPDQTRSHAINQISSPLAMRSGRRPSKQTPFGVMGQKANGKIGRRESSPLNNLVNQNGKNFIKVEGPIHMLAQRNTQNFNHTAGAYGGGIPLGQQHMPVTKNHNSSTNKKRRKTVGGGLLHPSFAPPTVASQVIGSHNNSGVNNQIKRSDISQGGENYSFNQSERKLVGNIGKFLCGSSDGDAEDEENMMNNVAHNKFSRDLSLAASFTPNHSGVKIPVGRHHPHVQPQTHQALNDDNLEGEFYENDGTPTQFNSRGSVVVRQFQSD
ncbi:hypothetical protein FGO68_gene14381 [Halteria grandinella]|uniref:Uncharacterized protein n=1 Tax=Halteria grandinella TaxID=5974 RepID=A0A8J8NC98_HALGN|nr:hypothetical protein FGO68_gene14381 [Halteria grandinella]